MANNFILPSIIVLGLIFVIGVTFLSPSEPENNAPSPSTPSDANPTPSSDNNPPASEPSQNTPKSPQSDPVPPTSTPDQPQSTEPDVTFTLTGKNFRFSMDGQESPVLRVKQGDRVRIEFSSTDGLHDWTIDEFSASTNQVSTGTSTFVEFTATEKGTFEYYCSVGSHRALGMFGTFIVE